MTFRTFVGPVFALMSAFQPVAAIQQVPDGFAYINSAADGTLYFGKQIAVSGDHSFMQVYSIETNGSTGQWMQTFNCADKTYELGTDEWKQVEPESVGQQWFDAACK